MLKQTEYTEAHVEILKGALDELFPESGEKRVKALDEMSKDKCTPYEQVKHMLCEALDDIRTAKRD